MKLCLTVIYEKLIGPITRTKSLKTNSRKVIVTHRIKPQSNESSSHDKPTKLSK